MGKNPGMFVKSKEVDALLRDSGLDEHKMTQPEVIDYLLKCSENNKRTIERSKPIQEKYNEYKRRKDQESNNYDSAKMPFFQRKTKEALDDFVAYTVDFFKGYVSWKIGSYCQYNQDIEDESMNLILKYLYKTVSDLDKENKDIENIGGYIRNGLDWRIRDFQSDAIEAKKHRELDDREGEEEENKSKNEGPKSAPPDEIPDADEWVLLYIFRRLIKTYCYLMMEQKADPPKQLALCYSRVLSHVDYEASETVAIHAKWAMKRMAKKDIFTLEKESEKELQRKIDKNLYWGMDFRKQVREKVVVKDIEYILGDVVYTDSYTDVDVERWSRSYHKRILKDIKKEEKKNDPEFYSLMKECVEVNDILRHFVDEDKEDER